MPNVNESCWGHDDCLHQILGDFKRPKWLRASTSIQALANFKKLFNGDIEKGVEWFGKAYGAGYNRIPNDSDFQPGDVVVGKTRQHDFAIAKVGKSHHPIIRTEIGYDTVQFIHIIAMWRPK